MKKEIKVFGFGIGEMVEKYAKEKIVGHPLWASQFLYSDPEAIYQGYMEFLRAGSQIISTITYQASIEGFIEHFQLGEREAIELMKKAVDLAKKAVKDYKEEIKDCTDVPNPEPLIAGSIGSYAAFLHDGSEYSGPSYANESMDRIVEWHKPRIEILVSEGVDLLAFHLMPCAKEVLALIEFLKQYPGGNFVF